MNKEEIKDYFLKEEVKPKVQKKYCIPERLYTGLINDSLIVYNARTKEEVEEYLHINYKIRRYIFG